MKIVEKNNEISLRDIPSENWALGVLFLFGVLLFGVIPLGNAGKTTPTTGGQIICLLTALFCLYCAYQKLSLPATLTRIKPDERVVEITTRRFLIIKKTARLRFSEIKRFEAVRRKPERAFLYFNVLTMRDGSQIDLEADGKAVEGAAQIISVRLNELLKKAEPGKRSGNDPIRARKNLKKHAKDESVGKIS